MNRHLLAIERCLEKVPAGTVQNLAARILEADHVYLSGAGRTGLVVKALAMRLAQIGLEVHVAGEPTAPAIITGDLLVVASGTGASRLPLRHLEVARTAGARVYSVVGKEESDLARAADWTSWLPVAEVQENPYPLGGLFEATLLLLFDLLVEEIRAQLRMTEQDLERRHANLE